MMPYVIAVISLLIAACALARLCRQQKQMEQWVGQIAHFLQYHQEPLPDSLCEGCLANLNNQIAGLERCLIHQIRFAAQREAQLIVFMENVTHQIKNTVTALQMQIDMLQLRTKPEDSAAIDRCQRNLDRLTEEVDRILKSSQLAAGKVVMNYEETDLQQLICCSAAKLSPIAKQRHVQVDTQNVTPKKLLLDAFWFAQAFENLLKNAIEHTEKGTTVLVTLQDDGGSLRLCIEDEGSGIAPEELSNLFTRFYRGSSAKKGYGIGLSMAKDIIQAHHGTLTAGNRETHGARFEIKIPVLNGKAAYAASLEHPKAAEDGQF